jgi:hypothetical protein|tara:strand:- start:4200 stop:6032 length:1833 start_codon:yes stop_codon:yes gene_type:complete
MEPKLTVYQRLSKMFGPEGPRQEEPTFAKYKFSKDDLLKTTSKAQYEKEKLTAQQTVYLSNQWQRVENEIYTQSVYYEPTRLASYYDYESMEFTPEISAALDIYAEESTTPSEDGHMLTIYSESSRIKSILADLFNNILDVNTNLPMWIRNTTKYGDNFVYLKIDPEKGVIGCRQLPNVEIERVEAGAFLNQDAEGEEKERKVKFIWKDKGMELNSWEIAHFRLLGDDRRLPYGTSMLEKARRTWKQMLLAEDAMLVYRTARAPERRIFKIFVGNMDDKDVEAYVQRVANKFKRDPVVDPSNGQVDLRYNQMAVDQDFFIPVRDQSAPSPIETLPGATNLSEIADIEYIQKKLLASLRVPKAFLGFEEVVGEGKNLALLDIRFARTINRIQKSIVQELNKIAIIHLYVLGFDEELDNFALGLTNPSTQSELLKLEAWQTKITLYKDAVSDPGGGISPVSATWAKKHVLGMSDEEIKLDLQQQRFEKAIAKELEDTATIIKKTGVFNQIDKLYGDVESTESEEGDEGGLPGGSDTESTPPPPMGGGGAPPPPMDMGGDAPEAAAESFKIQRDLPLILENKGINLPDIEKMSQKANREISKLNEEIDNLVKE